MHMIEVYVSTVLGPRTGGPEAVHQLVHSLRSHGVKTSLIPMRGSRGKSPHSDYSIYDFEVVSEISQKKDHRLVITEVSPLESWQELRMTPPEDTWLWWLSVNNAPDQRARYFSAQDKQSNVQPVWRESLRRGRLAHSFLNKARTSATEFISLSHSRSLLKSDINYLAQSEYAVDFCATELQRPATLLSDYLRELPALNPSAVRPHLVTYNGSRGYSLIGELERAMPEIEFMPISGMDYTQVCEILAESAAYIELGHLPGRDRLPREAGRLGTPVVLLQRGAGVYIEDFPLPDDYRIEFSSNWAQPFAATLSGVIRDRDQAVSDQGGYREWISGDRIRFDREVQNWIPKLLN